ncbi:Ysc84 actin-binding domain protein [Pseudohyphozyma bogoriensis]|nr:Ysc84 actin-binding domain protein [Pseudohyphozyma bogoriensis]
MAADFELAPAAAATPLPPPPKRTVPPPSYNSSTWAAPVTSHAPPPKRDPSLPVAKPAAPKDAPPPPGEKETWRAWGKRKSSAWGKTAMVKGVAISDNVGGRVNGWAEVVGSERFWPTTGDFPIEMEKAARILRAFTVDGVEHTVEEKSVKGIKKQRKVAKKIPSRIIRAAKGLVIFTSCRSGMAPFAGAGGAGLVVAKLDDGTWSAPTSISPNNLSAGLMFGVDIYDCVLIIRTQEALDSFCKHKVTLGAELAVVAGPYGAGAAGEVGLDRSPVLSYIRSRGFYAGFEAVGQIFIQRHEENEMMYYWPVSGKVKPPEQAESLYKSIHDAEIGRAQRMKGLDAEFEEELYPDVSQVELLDGEVLHLPPTPNQTIAEEEEELRLLKEEEKKRKA